MAGLNGVVHEAVPVQLVSQGHLCGCPGSVGQRLHRREPHCNVAERSAVQPNQDPGVALIRSNRAVHRSYGFALIKV